MKEVFDKMEEPNDKYAERFAEELRREFMGYQATAQNKVATTMQIAMRFVILSALAFFCACSLVISACIKYLFFS
tara:strand:- start:174 stop:398 length:225 start_codon:yes stop_codon:yes gene_type:complete